MSDIDALVDRAVAVVAGIARRGSAVTSGVAVLAGIVFGAAYLIGLAALGGSTRVVWAIVGGALLAIAIGAPLLATLRLRSIPRRANSLVGELRTLLNRDEAARQVIVDTVEAEPGAQPGAAPPMAMRGGFGTGGFGTGAFGGARSPDVVVQFQRFSSLRNFARSDDVRNLAAVARMIGSLPALLAAGIAITGLGAVLGFVFLLIWIF
jgi:hypothetical protein